MRMKAVAGLMMVLGLCVAAGCGGGGGGAQQSPTQAREIQDGAEKYDPPQVSCPVCGSKPISGDYHAEVEGKRIYFDKKECEKKFKQNSEKYLEDYTTYEESMKQAPETQ